MSEERWLDEVAESVAFVPLLDGARWTRLCSIYLRQAWERGMTTDEAAREQMAWLLQGIGVAIAVTLGLPAHDNGLVESLDVVEHEILASLLRGDQYGMTDEKATLYSLANALGLLDVGRAGR